MYEHHHKLVRLILIKPINIQNYRFINNIIASIINILRSSIVFILIGTDIVKIVFVGAVLLRNNGSIICAKMIFHYEIY